MKKINITTIVLTAYLLVVGVMAWSKPDRNDMEFFGTVGITLIIICLLRYLQIKRFKIRNERNKNNTPPPCE